jgi:serine/threonine protein kinase
MSQPEPSRFPETAQVPAGNETIFGRFELIRKLGQGGMGQVWLARDQMLDREVALKFLPDMLVHDPAALEDLRAETRRALRLTHEGIVRTYDFYCADQMACIAMEYVNGGTLSQLRLKEPKRVFEPEQILSWIEQACTALNYAHRIAKVAHRDLKPSNMMVDEAGRLKLTDFGIARSLGDSVSRVANRPNSSGTSPVGRPLQLSGG